MRTHPTWILVVSSIIGNASCSAPNAGSHEPPSTETSPVVKGGLGHRIKRNFIGRFQRPTAQWFFKMLRPGWIDGLPADLSFQLGQPTDTPLVGDWNGDGLETPGLWNAGTWRLSNTLTSNPPLLTFQYGDPTDVPFVGDWDGNGTSTPGVYRNGVFLLRNSNSTGFGDILVTLQGFQGAPGDIPLAGDWNGDGVETVGVYRPSMATFYFTNLHASPAPQEPSLHYGNQFEDKPVVGDWDGDGVTTVGLMRGSRWYLANDRVPGVEGINLFYGQADDVPLAGNWNPDAPTGDSAVPASLASFFPIAADFQPSRSFEEWKNRGINTVIRVPGPYAPFTESIDAWTAGANALGLKMIRDAREDPDADDGETNLLAWIIADEPDAQGIDSYEFLRDRYLSLKARNARPIFFNFNGGLVLPPFDRLCEGPGDEVTLRLRSTCYAKLISTEDWVSQDYYAVNLMRPISDIGRITDKLTRWSSGKPQFTYLETALIHSGPNTVPPTRGEFRAEVWHAIIHGARGIFYFPHDVNRPDLWDTTPPHIVDEMRIQNARMTALAPVLQSAINPPNLGFRGGLPLEATWRQYDGAKYFIVLNLSPGAVTPTMRVTGLFFGSPSLFVVGENRVVALDNHGSFSDSFGPYEVHIYRS